MDFWRDLTPDISHWDKTRQRAPDKLGLFCEMRAADELRMVDSGHVARGFNSVTQIYSEWRAEIYSWFFDILQTANKTIYFEQYPHPVIKNFESQWKKCPGERFRQCFAVIEIGRPMVVHVRSIVASLLTALSSTIYPAVRCNVSSLSIVALHCTALHCTALLHLHNYNYNHSPTQARALQPRGGEANNLNGRSPLGSVLGSVPRLVTICLAKYWGVEESPSTFLSEDESLLSCNLEGTLQQRRIIYLIWDHACILETYFWSPNPVPSII